MCRSPEQCLKEALEMKGLLEFWIDSINQKYNNSTLTPKEAHQCLEEIYKMLDADYDKEVAKYFPSHHVDLNQIISYAQQFHFSRTNSRNLP